MQQIATPGCRSKFRGTAQIREGPWRKVYDDIAAGRLVPVLDGWDLPRLTINLAYPSRKHLSAKVRTFIDCIADHFARMDYERKWTGRFGVH